jgi:hypothetical protein
MKNKIILTLLPLFLFLFHTEAAIFIPNAIQNQSHSNLVVNGAKDDVQNKEPKVSKKDKKAKKEKQDKVDNFAKWGFIASVVGFASIFFLPLLGFVLLPVGVGFSIAGLSATVKNKTRGKGLAIAGLAVGSAGILLILLAVVLVLSLISNWGG